MPRCNRTLLGRAVVVLVTGLLVLTATGQKKSFDASSFVSQELLNGPSSIPQVRLKSVKLDESSFGVVAAKADVDTGQVRRVDGQISLPKASTERQSVDLFVKRHAELLGATSNSDDLKLLREVKSPAGDHFYYQQQYHGLPVWGGRLSVHNVIGSKAARVVNDLRKLSPETVLFEAKPTFNESDRPRAIDVAEKAVKFNKLASQPPTVEQGFIEIQGHPIPVWRVRYGTSDPGAEWEVMVSAQDLKPISARNVAAYQQGSKALVFRDDPIQSTGNISPGRDVLQAARVSVALSDLYGNGQLDGKFATTNLTTAFTRANSTTLDFTYDADDPHFRETMSYYWVTENAHYLASLGYGSVLINRIGINVDGTADDNSWYAHGTLTFGSGGIPDAEDAEVIFHELGHAIQDAQVPGLLDDGGEEVRAISEGFGDYWAASYFGGAGPKGTAWDVFFDKWDGATVHPGSGGNPPYLRLLETSKKYPVGLDGEVHDDGEIWSACLWKIRSILGKDLAAKIILESNFHLTPTSKFSDAAEAILATNKVLNGGAHEAAIRSVFEDRGILAPVAAAKKSASKRK